MTLPQATKRWLHRLAKQGRKPRTLAKYRATLDGIGEFVLSRITTNQLRNYCDSAHASATRAKRVQIFKQFFAWARREGLTGRNPAEDLEAAKVHSRRVVPLTPDQIGAILNALAAPNGNTSLACYALVEVMVATGLRLGDALRLSPAAARDGVLALRTEKTGADLAIAFPDRLLPNLCLIQSWVGGRNPRTVARKVQRRLKRAFLDARLPRATPHAFRHTRASLLASRGASTQEIAWILGISEAVAARSYVHLTRAAAERLLRLQQEESAARRDEPSGGSNTDSHTSGSGPGAPVGADTTRGRNVDNPPV